MKKVVPIKPDLNDIISIGKKKPIIAKTAVTKVLANENLKKPIVTSKLNLVVKKGVSEKKIAQQNVKTVVKKRDSDTNQEQNAEEKAVQATKPAVPFVKVEEIKLIQLVKKMEFYRDNNRSVLIIDKLEMNDSYTFFKYKGTIIDMVQLTVKEMMGGSHADSIEFARKLTSYALKTGQFLVFALDKSTYNLPTFFSGADFFSPEELFTPNKVCEAKYYREKLITKEEDIDGFGNKGSYFPNTDFLAILHSKSQDQTPEEILISLGMPLNIFDVLIIS